MLREWFIRVFSENYRKDELKIMLKRSFTRRGLYPMDFRFNGDIQKLPIKRLVRDRRYDTELVYILDGKPWRIEFNIRNVITLTWSLKEPLYVVFHRHPPNDNEIFVLESLKECPYFLGVILRKNGGYEKLTVERAS